MGYSRSDILLVKNPRIFKSNHQDKSLKSIMERFKEKMVLEWWSL